MDTEVIDEYPNDLFERSDGELSKILLKTHGAKITGGFERYLFETPVGKDLIHDYIKRLKNTRCMGYDFWYAFAEKAPSDAARFIFEYGRGHKKHDIDVTFSIIEGGELNVPFDDIIDNYYDKWPFYTEKTAENNRRSAALKRWLMICLSKNQLYGAARYRLMRAMLKKSETDHFKKLKKQTRHDVAQKKLRNIFKNYSDVVTEKVVTDAWKDYTIDMVMDT